MDCIVHGVAKSQTRLSHFHFTKVVNSNQHIHWPSTILDSSDVFLCFILKNRMKNY